MLPLQLILFVKFTLIRPDDIIIEIPSPIEAIVQEYDNFFSVNVMRECQSVIEDFK